MNAHSPTRAPWSFFLIAVAAMFLLAFDTSQVSATPASYWTVIYLISAGSLIAWRVRGHRTLLLVSGSCLFTASLTRVAVFIERGDRWSGVGVNVLLMLLTLSFVSSRRWKETRY